LRRCTLGLQTLRELLRPASAPCKGAALLFTVVSVIAGLAANEAWAVRVGFLAGRGMLPVWALQLGLSALFLGSYWRARRTQRALAASSPMPRDEGIGAPGGRPQE
jgi:hypothetical protein